MQPRGLDVTRLFRLPPRAPMAAVQPQRRAGRDADFDTSISPC